MQFDKAEHIRKMKPHVDKLVGYFKKRDISFSPIDGEMDNVVFTSKDNEIKISHHSFYRFSGIAFIRKDKGEHYTEQIEVTDGMFMEHFMIPIIEKLLKITHHYGH